MSSPISQLASLAGFDASRVYSELLFTALLVWCCLAPLPPSLVKFQRHCVTSLVSFCYILTIKPYYKSIAEQFATSYYIILTSFADFISTLDLRSIVSFVVVVGTLIFSFRRDHIKSELNRLTLLLNLNKTTTCINDPCSTTRQRTIEGLCKSEC